MLAGEQSMAKKFDPMHEWLGISPAEQPPSHYRLLGIEKFESRPDVIQSAANRLKDLLQKNATAGHGEDAKDLYEEVKKAKKILLNEERKAIYDRLLAKESRKRFVAPSRSARNHKLEESDVDHELRRKELSSYQAKPGLPTAMVLACVGLMLLATILGVVLIVTFGQRRSAGLPTVPVSENLELEKKEPDPGINKVNGETNPPSSDPVPEKTKPAVLDSDSSEIVSAPLDPPVGPIAEKQPSPMNEKPLTANVNGNTGGKKGTAPNAHSHWEEMFGLQSSLKGRVQKVHVSQSGKTRYIYFSTDQRDAIVYLYQRLVGDELSEEFLQRLNGKLIRVTGKVGRDIGTKRIGITIENESQIEILD